jgi:hypothetical protein
MLWNYFASGHGKGEVDGANALLKRELHKEQLKPHGVNIQKAHEAIIFLQLESNKYHVVHPNVQMKVNKTFWEVNVGYVDKSHDFHCQIVVGS